MSAEIKQDKPLRIGLIGAGRIVERAHLPLLSSMSEVCVAGLYDANPARALEMTQRFGLPDTCRSVDELFSLDLDAALVACPNHLHAEMSIAALEANLHVLCEKPMATTLAHGRAMCQTAERMGRELMIACANRFRPEVVALRRVIQEGQLGAIKAIRCGWLRRNGVPGAGTWFTSRAEAGGGALTDLGSHLIDLALWLGGRRQLLAAGCVVERAIDPAAQASWYSPTSATTEARCDVEVGADGFVVFDGPLDVFIEVSWASAVPYDQTYLHVIGNRGIAKLETLFGFSPLGHRPKYPLRIWVDGQLLNHQVASAPDVLQPYRAQLEFFIDSVRNGRSLRPGLHDGLATVQVTEAMYTSAEQWASGGRPSF